ncbi:catalase family peroxidase [Sphingomonas sp. ASY06-1R]|uniref:catalase family peroxidase n=1 Tax=Sphingomonas sp. ASY06-1R TaxID=3445771 RepID=UPI003FA1E303
MTRPAGSKRPTIVSLGIIAAVVGGAAGAFAYTAGWLSPDRISPDRVADGFGPGVVAGHRINHAKGTCFVGSFHSTGAGAALSTAPMLAKGDFPIVGRFNLGTPDPFAKDDTVRVRGIGMLISAPGGAQWRTAMINAPVFIVSTPQQFYELLQAGGSKDSEAMAKFTAAHPGTKPFLTWAMNGPWTGSYADEGYNGLNSFVFTDAAHTRRTVRWSMTPMQPVRRISATEFAKTGPDALEREIADRIARAPAKWMMTVQIAGEGDPTGDPSKAWPSDRRTVTLGEITADRVIAEADGPCRDLNFDPTVLPVGISTSDDPFPAARSAVYAKSFDRRTAGAANYPRHTNPDRPANTTAKEGGR